MKDSERESERDIIFLMLLPPTQKYTTNYLCYICPVDVLQRILIHEGELKSSYDNVISAVDDILTNRIQVLQH